MSGPYFNRGGASAGPAPVRAFDGKASVMTANRLTKEGETMRIHAKTFAAWMNVHLRKRQLRVNDLTQDLSDGIMLIQLVEVLTGQQCMMNYNKAPRMDIQKVENVAIALQFIGNFTKVNVNPKDIVSGDLKVILSVIWRLVINFQVLQGNDSSSQNAAALKREAKAKLLGWVQEKTGEVVHDCDRSFDDGMIYCKLIYAFNPSLINLEQMRTVAPYQRLQYAFDVIEKNLLIEKMVFAEDICNNDPSQRPDEQCILTYLSHFPAAFLKLRQTPDYLSPDAVSIQNIPISFPSIPSLSSTAPTSSAPPASKSNNAPRYLVNNNLPSPPSISANHPPGSSAPVFPSPPSSNQAPSFPSPPPSNPSLSNPSLSVPSGFNAPGSPFPSIPASVSSPSPSFNLPSAPGASQFNSSSPLSSQTQLNSSLNSNPSLSSGGTGAYQSNLGGNQPFNQIPSSQPFASQISPQFDEKQLNAGANPYSSALSSNSLQRPPPSSDFGTNPTFNPLTNSPVPSAYTSGLPGTLSSGMPQRPPPPSSDFGSNLSGMQPQRPPLPVSSFTPMVPVPSTPAPAPPSDYALDLLKKEQELKEKEEELRRRQEELNRMTAAQEEELRKLREQAIKETDNQVQQLQQQLQQQRISGIAKLELEVKAARNLLPVKLTGNSSPYVVITVDKQKEKTSTIKSTIHPSWNEAAFKFFLENPNQSVNITIYSKSSIGADEFLGKVEIPIKNIPMGERKVQWFTLQPKKPGGQVSGEVQLGFLLSR